MRKMILSIDPGRDKCGLALVSKEGVAVRREVVETACLPDALDRIISGFDVEALVIGDRTFSDGIIDIISKSRHSSLAEKIVFVDEDRSSDEGRRRYLMDNPPRGLERILPIGLRSPKRPYDDYVAEILAERFIEGRLSTRKDNRKSVKRDND